MSLAIEHLHKHGLVHRDIALRNYVLTEDLQTPVLVDFGLSWPIEEKEFVAIRSGEKIPWRQMPPEVFQEHRYSKASDIWQLGLSFWQLLLLGRQPFARFQNGTQLAQYLKQKMVVEDLHVPLSFKRRGASSALKKIVKEIVIFCCQYEPAARPNATDVASKIDSLHKSVVPPSKWEWMDDGFEWRKYDHETSCEIEDAFKRKEKNVHLNVGFFYAKRGQYTVDFDMSVQQYKKTEKKREVRRNAPKGQHSAGNEEEKQMAACKASEDDVHSGLEQYNFTNYETGGDYMELAENSEDQPYEEIEDFPDDTEEESEDDVEDEGYGPLEGSESDNESEEQHDLLEETQDHKEVGGEYPELEDSQGDSEAE